MAYQSIGLGSAADDGTGDSLRAGGTKVNANFSEIYTLLGTGTALVSSITADADDVTFVGDSYNAVWDKSASALAFADSAKATFGTGNDLSIYHSGSHSDIVDSGTGNLRLLGSQIDIASEAADETMASFVDDGAVTLYYDNSAKIATTNVGAKVTGVLSATGFTIGSAVITEAELELLDCITLGTAEASKAVVLDANGDIVIADSDKWNFGTSSDMVLYHDGTDSYITNKTGALKLATETSGIAVKIGHTTSETTVNDNLTVTGN